MKLLFDKFFRIPVNHPKGSLLFLAVVTVIACTGLTKIQFENSLDVMMPQHDIEYITNENLKQVYGNNGKFIIIDISSESLFSESVFRETDNIISEIEEYKSYNEERESERIARIDSLIQSRTPVTKKDLINTLSRDPLFAKTVERKLGSGLSPDDIISIRKLKSLKSSLEKTRDIKTKEYVNMILSPFTMKDLSGRDDTLTAYDLIPADDNGKRILPSTDKEFDDFKKLLKRNPAFRNGIYAENNEGDITDFGIFVRLSESNDHSDIAGEIRQIAESYNSPGSLKITTQGAPVLYRQIIDYMQRDLKFFVPLVLFVVCIIFYLNFRTIQGVVIPLITLIMADAWVLGLMGHLGFKISVIGISLPPLIISVGSSYSIHIMNRFLIDSEKIRGDKAEGIFTSMQMVGMTLFLAGVTTITGFLTNMATQVSSIFEWGIFAALGTAFAVFIASLFIPAVFTFIDIRKSPGESAGRAAGRDRGIVLSILDVCSILAVKHPGKVIAGAVVIIAVSAAGIFQLESETSLQSYFSRSDYINRSSCEIGKKFGGTMGLNILIDSGETDGVKDPGFLNKTEELRGWLTSPENKNLHIGRTDAFGDFIRTINMAMHNDDPAFYSIPDSKTDLIDYLEIYSGSDENSDGRIDEFEPYVDPEFRTVNIFARLSESEDAMLGTADISRIVEKIRTHFNSELNSSGYGVTISGEPLIIISLAKYVVRGQMWSLLLSFIAVTMIVAVLFRNTAAGLISAVPIITAVIVNFGIMGWTGIKLDIATAIIASITIGIGVDNTIHFLNTYRHAAQKFSSIDDAVNHTLKTGGKAIIFTALALIAGFSVLVISQFKPIFLFGILLGFTFITTTAGAILILPALIKLTEFNPEESRVIIPRIITEPYVIFKNSITANRYLNLINITVRSRILRFLNSRDAN